MSQFRPVQHIGDRKQSNPQFKANYDLIARRPPKPEKAERPKGACKGKEDTCKAYAVKGGDLCAGHARSLKKQEGGSDESR
tara:strand:- start:1005 stop:1247 length:243 start_codon:yes stop_codon:yes gene_type:complete